MSPNQPKTPLRTLRVSDELWQKAQRVAAQKGTTVSAVLRAALEAFVEEGERGASRTD